MATAAAPLPRLTKEMCPVIAFVQYGELYQLGHTGEADDPFEYVWDGQREVWITWDDEDDCVEDFEGFDPATGIYYHYPFEEPNEHCMRIVRIVSRSTGLPDEPDTRPAADAQPATPLGEQFMSAEDHQQLTDWLARNNASQKAALWRMLYGDEYGEGGMVLAMTTNHPQGVSYECFYCWHRAFEIPLSYCDAIFEAMDRISPAESAAAEPLVVQ